MHCVHQCHNPCLSSKRLLQRTQLCWRRRGGRVGCTARTVQDRTHARARQTATFLRCVNSNYISEMSGIVFAIVVAGLALGGAAGAPGAKPAPEQRSTPQTIYQVGVGTSDVTGPAAEVNLMGYAMLEQTARGDPTLGVRGRMQGSIVRGTGSTFGDAAVVVASQAFTTGSGRARLCLPMATATVAAAGEGPRTQTARRALQQRQCSERPPCTQL